MGRSTVLRFLDEGARVVIADFNQANGTAVVAEAEQAGHGDAVRFLQTDVAKEADVEAMLALATSTFGQVDIVFNNAGVGGAVGPVWDIEVAEWDYTFDVLTKGVFLGIKHAARAHFCRRNLGLLENATLDVALGRALRRPGRPEPSGLE